MTALNRPWALGLRKRALNLGLYGHRRYTPFIVLGRSRVGSNLLRGLLNAHPQVVAYGEVFRDVESLDWDHVGYFQTEAMRTLVQRDPVRFLDREVFARYPRFVRAAGFKLFYYHARDGELAAVWPYLRGRRDLKVVHLTRRNTLKTHLSRKRAALTGQWVKTAVAPSRGSSVELDYEECLNDFVETRNWEESADREFTGHAVLRLEYERLADDYPNEMRAVQDFLGVDRHPLQPSTSPQSRESLSTSISNYDELKDRFRGTPWAEFFTD